MSTTVPTQSTASSSAVFRRPERYEIEGNFELERARTGSRFRAYDDILEQPAIVKLLQPGTGSEGSRVRFEKKARRLRDLNHPNLVPVSDFGYHHGIAYIAQEQVDGRRLSKHLARSGPLDFRKFAQIILTTLEGLAALHRVGIVHGDVQPENIWLSFCRGHLQKAVLGGYGLPDLAAESSIAAPSDTIEFERAAAIAPERIRGDDADERLDLYALGCTAYEMLTGQPPFDRDRNGREALERHLHEDPQSLETRSPADHGVPPEIVRWIHDMMAKDPSERPASAVAAKYRLLEATGTRIPSRRLLRVPTPEFHPERNASTASDRRAATNHDDSGRPHRNAERNTVVRPNLPPPNIADPADTLSTPRRPRSLLSLFRRSIIRRGPALTSAFLAAGTLTYFLLVLFA